MASGKGSSGLSGETTWSPQQLLTEAFFSQRLSREILGRRTGRAESLQSLLSWINECLFCLYSLWYRVKKNLIKLISRREVPAWMLIEWLWVEKWPNSRPLNITFKPTKQNCGCCIESPLNPLCKAVSSATMEIIISKMRMRVHESSNLILTTAPKHSNFSWFKGE